MNVHKIKKLIAIFWSIDKLWYLALLKYRVAPSIEHMKVLKSVRPDLVIDIGANRGQFSLAALRAYPNAQVICFEPLSSAYAVLAALLRSQSRVVIHHIAIGDTETDMSMNISNKEDSSSLLDISDLQAEIFPGTDRRDSEKVSVSRLSNFIPDDVLSKTIFIKIDVQGYELEVLRGAIDMLSKVKYIYCECSFLELYKNQAVASEVIDFLSNQGFSLDGVYNLSSDRSGIAVQADCLFVNKKIS